MAIKFLDGHVQLTFPVEVLAKALGVSVKDLQGKTRQEVLSLLGLNGIGRPEPSDEEIGVFLASLGLAPRGEQG